MTAYKEVFTNIVTDGSSVAKFAGAAAAVGVLVKAMTPVGEQEMGIRTRFGKVSRHRWGEQKGAPKIVGPGLRLTFPGIQSISRIDVNQRSTDLDTLVVGITEADQLRQYRIASSIVWAVGRSPDSLYGAKFKTDTLKETITNICVGGLLKVCHEVDSPSELYDSETMYQRTESECASDLSTYGVALTGLYLTSIAETEAQVIAGAVRDSNSGVNNILAAMVGTKIGLGTTDQTA